MLWAEIVDKAIDMVSKIVTGGTKAGECTKKMMELKKKVDDLKALRDDIKQLKKNVKFNIHLVPEIAKKMVKLM